MKSIVQNLRLEEVADRIDYGFTASAEKAGSGPKFLRITDIQGDSVTWNSVPYCNCSDNEYERYALKDGDIVFARTGATTGKSFLLRNLVNRAVFASYLIRVRPSKSVDPVYLSHFFRSPQYWNQITTEMVGAAQPGVNASRLSTLLVPIPALTEQRRIAEILDQADAIRRKREQALALTDDLLRSTFLDMFGDPAVNSKKWPMTTIRDLVSEVKYGTSEKSGPKGAFPVLRMNNITYEGSWDFSSLKYMDLHPDDEQKYLAYDGDLLFNRTNSKELVGKTAVFREPLPMAFAGYLIRVRTNRYAHNEYIAGFLNSSHGKFTLLNMCKNIIGMANINAQELQNIPIPKPPVDLQNQFAERTRSILKQAKNYGEVVGVSNYLFDSLVQRAFRGEL